jgi:hypothetical protein
MSTRLFDQWLEITAEAAQKAAQHGLAAGQDCVEFGTRHVRLLAEAKDPQEWMAEEARIVSEFGQKLVNRAGDGFKAARETQEALSELAETSTKAAMDYFAMKSV